MQKYRFPDAEIFVTEKHVEFCGKIVKKSKKKVRWIVEHRKIQHKIQAMISFISGKKKLLHNGMTIVQLQNSLECLSAVVMLGMHKINVRIERQQEELKLDSQKYNKNVNEFSEFKNVMSGQIEAVYEKFFNPS